MTGRDQALAAFLAAHGWADATRKPLAGDASTRRYTRLDRAGARAVLMEAPAAAHNTPQFIAIGAMLRDLGLSAPAVLAADTDAGLVLLEDFGDTRFGDRMDAGDDATALLSLAVDVLIELHRRFDATTVAARGLPRFDAARFHDQLALFPDVVLPRAGPLAGDVVETFRAAWTPVLAQACQVPQSLLLRDYFADNLMWLDSRPGIAACGLLDFQDGGIGPVTYDLMSLLDDARRDIPAGIADMCRQRYLAAFPTLDRELFELSCEVLAAVRACRIVAVFLRLQGQGKAGYARHLPRVWAQFDRRLQHPALRPVHDWLMQHLPAERRPAG